jgi:hypothetical protein
MSDLFSRCLQDEELRKMKAFGHSLQDEALVRAVCS